MDLGHRRTQRRPDATPAELRRSHERAGLTTQRDRGWETFWRWDKRKEAVWNRASLYLYAWLAALDTNDPDTLAAANDQWLFEPWSRRARSYLQRRQSAWGSAGLKKAHRLVDLVAVEGYGLTACGEVEPLARVDWRRVGQTRNDTDPCSRCRSSPREPALGILLAPCERAGSAFPQGTAWEPRVLRMLRAADPALAQNRQARSEL